MRPRPDAAENLDQSRHPRGLGRASMRPRPDAAENRYPVPPLRSGLPGASMRPRPDAAENRRRPAAADRRGRRFNEAAARCRGKRPTAARPQPAAARFNEAAARCRGKPPRNNESIWPMRRASMRPRPDAAENQGSMPMMTRFGLLQ